MARNSYFRLKDKGVDNILKIANVAGCKVYSMITHIVYLKRGWAHSVRSAGLFAVKKYEAWSVNTVVRLHQFPVAMSKPGSILKAL